MATTKIEYGERNWNFFPGCNGPNGIPCSYCWSRKRVLPRMKCKLCQTLEPHYHPERMNEPLHTRKPTRWLVNFAGDWMGQWVPDTVIREARLVMRARPDHTFLTLTKQPQRLAEFSPFPDNCWVGVSATNYSEANNARYYLGLVKAKVKYLSIEPLLEPLQDRYEMPFAFGGGISWAIIGGVTKCPELPQPKFEWIREIVEAADHAGVKVWLKESLLTLFAPNRIQDLAFQKQYRWALNPAGTYLRQEMPEVK